MPISADMSKTLAEASSIDELRDLGVRSSSKDEDALWTPSAAHVYMCTFVHALRDPMAQDWRSVSRRAYMFMNIHTAIGAKLNIHTYRN